MINENNKGKLDEITLNKCSTSLVGMKLLNRSGMLRRNRPVGSNSAMH